MILGLDSMKLLFFQNPLEVINLRKELAGKDERIRQLESTILKLNSNDVKDMNTSADSANVSIDVFKARVLSLKAALGQCSSVSERCVCIGHFLVGAFSLKEKSPTLTVSSFFSVDNLTLSGPLFYNLLFLCFLRSLVFHN